MTALEEIHEISHELPLTVLRDIERRCSDWLVAGGKENDPYIKQQLRYAKNVIEHTKKIRSAKRTKIKHI